MSGMGFFVVGSLSLSLFFLYSRNELKRHLATKKQKFIKRKKTRREIIVSFLMVAEEVAILRMEPFFSLSILGNKFQLGKKSKK